jgi:hypothetical protein
MMYLRYCRADRWSLMNGNRWLPFILQSLIHDTERQRGTHAQDVSEVLPGRPVVPYDW